MDACTQPCTRSRALAHTPSRTCGQTRARALARTCVRAHACIRICPKCTALSKRTAPPMSSPVGHVSAMVRRVWAAWLCVRCFLGANFQSNSLQTFVGYLWACESYLPMSSFLFEVSSFAKPPPWPKMYLRGDNPKDTCKIMHHG